MIGVNETELPLVAEDAAFFVLDKPAGLLAVPGRGEDKQDCLSSRVQQLDPHALVVHRLDMATSGLLLMARHPEAQRRLSLAFAERQVYKRYVAVVQGHIAKPTTEDGWGLIDLPIAADWPNRPLRVIDPLQGKPSQTRWRVQSHGPDTTRVLLEPITGRSHQLRVHLKALGHPIVGDALYGQAAERLYLHAAELAFAHPVSGEWLSFSSPAPF